MPQNSQTKYAIRENMQFVHIPLFAFLFKNTKYQAIEAVFSSHWQMRHTCAIIAKVAMKVSREKVNSIIKRHIEPLLSVDGGSVEVVVVNKEHNLVRIRFGGSYYGSPCRSTVFKYLIEPVLKEEISQLHQVEWVD
jgi:Fe-S cluster biogenesis protein NfuA